MRKTSSSVNALEIASFSCLALARSWPNGFSAMIRVQPAPRRLPTCSTIDSKALGGTAR